MHTQPNNRIHTGVVGKVSAIKTGTFKPADGVKGVLKTAKGVGKIADTGYKSAAKTLSNTDNEYIATVGKSAKHTHGALQAGGKAAKKTLKTALDGERAVRTIKTAAHSIESIGLSKTVTNFAMAKLGLSAAGAAGSATTVGTAATAKAATDGASATNPYGWAWLIVQTAIAINVVIIVSLVIMAVVGFIVFFGIGLGSSGIGALFQVDDELAAFKEVQQRVDDILNNEKFRQKHIDGIIVAFPEIEVTNNEDTIPQIPPEWEAFTSQSAIAEANARIIELVNEIETNNAADEDFGGITFASVIDVEPILNDFAITNYVDFFVMMFLTKYGSEITDEDDFDFTDDELKANLLNQGTFTAESAGFPILRDTVFFDVELEQTEDYDSIISYVITITVIPRLVEVSVNPRDFMEDTEENQELFEQFDFATMLLNELMEENYV